MRKYHVFVPEVHYQTVEIEAPSPEEAVKAVLDGNGDPVDDTLEYSHQLDVTKLRVKDLATNLETSLDPYEADEGDADEEVEGEEQEDYCEFCGNALATHQHHGDLYCDDCWDSRGDANQVKNEDD